MNFEELIWREPWLAPVIMNLSNIVPTNSIFLAGVTPDGKTLYYNPKAWRRLTPAQKLGVQAHEILHIVNLHSTRRDYRTAEKWNKACDIAINYQLTAARYKLPKWVLAGENDTAENIYDRLMEDEKLKGNSLFEGSNEFIGSPTDEELQDENGEINEDMLTGDLLDKNFDGSKGYASEETLEACERAVIFAGRGITPLSRAFTPSVAKGDWKNILRKFVNSLLGGDLDYISYEFDEFGICEDLLLPKPQRPRICALVDESGSIADELYSDFLAELRKMQLFADVFASGFADSAKLNDVPLKLYTRTMTGGTYVLDVYKQACEKQYDCIIILTDGHLDFPPKEPSPTLWAMPKSHGRKTEVLI